MDLHIKYRPNSLDAVIGNKGVISSLKNLLSNEPPHVFLFIGNSGCGKTTLSRIVAEQVGCNQTAIREINSADMRGIDFMRDLIKESKYTPLEGESKAYILDEFHQVSTDAQNALLKILEDTPSHVYFMLCTTSPEKIIETIKNRCHKFTVNPLLNREIRWIIDNVIKSEGLKIPEEIIKLIVDSSDGIPRTALVLLSTLSGVSRIEEAENLVYKEIYNSAGIADLCKIIMGRRVTWGALSSLVSSMEIKEYERTRIAMLAYFIGCIKNSNNKTNREILTNLADICAVSLSYTTAKYEFFLMLSRLYSGVN